MKMEATAIVYSAVSIPAPTAANQVLQSTGAGPFTAVWNSALILGASPPAAGPAVRIDAASYTNGVVFEAVNGAITFRMAVVAGSTANIGTESSTDFRLRAGAATRWVIINAAAGIASFQSGQATARIIGGATNGLSIRNSADSRDNINVTDSGARMNLNDGTRNAEILLNATVGALTGGAFYSSSLPAAGGAWLVPDFVNQNASAVAGIGYRDSVLGNYRIAVSIQNAAGLGTLQLMPAGGNAVIGGTAAGATASGVLAFAIAATEPTASVDLVHIYGFDLSAANRALAVYAEAALIASIDQIVTNKVPFRYNGTTLYLMATTSAA